MLRLGVPPTLARTLRSTNCIESMISVCREHAANVKRWRDGQMALRWCAAGMVEAGKQFRRVNGHLHLPSLRAALEREIADLSNPSCTMTRRAQPDAHRTAAEVPRNLDILAVAQGWTWRGRADSARRPPDTPAVPFPAEPTREISRQAFLRAAAGALAAGTVFGSVRATADPKTSGWPQPNGPTGSFTLVFDDEFSGRP